MGCYGNQFHVHIAKRNLGTNFCRIQGVPMKNLAPMRNCLGGHVRLISRGSFNHIVVLWHCNYDQLLTESIKPQSHIHGFGPGRATVHPDLSKCGASA